jgi:hypothetical protein
MTNAPRPVCFMVMGYRVKEVPGPPRPGVPASVDCDALWERVYRPALEQLGYQAVRGDYDPSSVILTEMLERLAWADLVVADVTIPNGNVYYEVGLRHVAVDTHCVLAAADWSMPLFDISSFSSIRFPLSDGRVSEADAAAAIKILVEKIPLLKETRTPYYELVRDTDETRRRGAFRENVARLDAFQSGAREVRLITDKGARIERIAALRAATPTVALEMPDVAVELLTLIRDCAGWQEVVAFIDTLPPAIRKLGFVEEQRLLAIGQDNGDLGKAVAGLETLIKAQGATPERKGLLGGRYRRLWQKALDERKARGETAPSADENRFLNAAIQSYSDGLDLDLNEYYCTTNLPPLLTARGRPADLARLRYLNDLAYQQCQRARTRGSHDPWLPPTLFNCAIRADRFDDAQKLIDDIASDPVGWQVESLLGTLKLDVGQAADPERKATLQGLHDQLAVLVPKS